MNSDKIQEEIIDIDDVELNSIERFLPISDGLYENIFIKNGSITFTINKGNINGRVFIKTKKKHIIVNYKYGKIKEYILINPKNKKVLKTVVCSGNLQVERSMK